jgi:predicted pyridoxine 5'-phosphate oxidase superfamily flavin-nucleotide-binding protein
MGRVLEAITDELAEFIAAQRVFFVATAPTEGGHLNVSPKGLDTFAVLDPNTVAYLDLTGSGVETVAHLRENGRITIMFCAFDGKPNIVRLYGHGQVIEASRPDAQSLRDRFPAYPGARAIITVEVDRVSTSCGYAVPKLRYEAERPTLLDWANRKGEDGLRAYRAEQNARSVDDLPALDEPH